MNKIARKEYYKEHNLTPTEISNSESYLKEKNKKEYLRVSEAKAKQKNKVDRFRKILDTVEDIKFSKLSATTDGQGCYFTMETRGGLEKNRYYQNWNDLFSDIDFFKSNLNYL